MLYKESLTYPSLLPFRRPGTPRMRCSANIGLGSWGTSHRWDLYTVAHIYISHTGMCLYRCTACYCLPYRQLCPWSRSSHHQSSHHHTGTGHTCTALGLHTTFWMRFVIKLDLEPLISQSSHIVPVVPVRTVIVCALAVSSVIQFIRVFSLVALTEALHAPPPVAANRIVRTWPASVIILWRWIQVTVAPLSSVRLIALTSATH